MAVHKPGFKHGAAAWEGVTQPLSYTTLVTKPVASDLKREQVTPKRKS